MTFTEQVVPLKYRQSDATAAVIITKESYCALRLIILLHVYVSMETHIAGSTDYVRH